MSNKEKIYLKSLDYATVYADGVICQMGDQVSRLIFYQKEIIPSEAGTEIDVKKHNFVMKFEVRLPRSRMERLAENMYKIANLSDAVHNATSANEDETAVHRWYIANEKIGESLYDTDDYEITDQEILTLSAKIQEEYPKEPSENEPV